MRRFQLRNAKRGRNPAPLFIVRVPSAFAQATLNALCVLTALKEGKLLDDPTRITRPYVLVASTLANVSLRSTLHCVQQRLQTAPVISEIRYAAVTLARARKIR
jgi:hypothetical protein